MKRFARLYFFTLKSVWFVVSLFTIFACVTPYALAQTAESVSQVKRVTLDWATSAKGSAGVRERVEQKLKSTGKIQIVTGTAQADAVLHGSATVWTTGLISSSPRSKSAEQATYQGYASAELNGKSGKTLWSYLVTPRRQGWKSITDDLGDQLAGALVEALRQKEGAAKAAGSGSPEGAGGGSISELKLEGAGGTFPAPIYRKWFESFQQTRPGIQVRYDAVGSEEGIRRIQEGAVDFGASDIPLSAEQLRQNNGRLLQFATVLGAVVPIYNVKGAPDGLNLTPAVLAEIFLGKISSWDAPEIRAINKHVRLPGEKIVVVHRSDGSGTTYAWTEYLSKVNAEWKSWPGAGATVTWPVGLGAEGNLGVADAVFKTANSIGYVEFIYALQHELSFAAVQNASGEYVKADLDSVTAAAKTAGATEGKSTIASITNASGKHTYPIATFTWVLISAEGKDAKKQEVLREMVRWMLTSGQKECQGLGYAPLPVDFAARQLQELGASK
jgi:phosphate transport system substrate-binding protein